MYALSFNKWYWDHLLDVKAVEAGKGLNRVLWRVDALVVDGGVNGAGWFTRFTALVSGGWDKYVVDGLVNASGWFARFGSIALRAVQTGFWQNYALLFSIGLFFALLIFERRAIGDLASQLYGNVSATFLWVAVVVVLVLIVAYGGGPIARLRERVAGSAKKS